jgi:predicted ATPase
LLNFVYKRFGGTSLNNLFIQGVLFEWNEIEPNSYIRTIESLRDVEKIEFQSPVSLFVGENGTGKSTLLEAIAVAHGFNPEGGTKNYVFSTYDSHSELCDAIRIAKGYRKEKWGYFLRAESFYNVATQEEKYADIAHPSMQYHKKSHGESFLDLAQDNIKSNGLYLLDEPEAALSPQRQLTLLTQIYKCANDGAQFIIATHSPILLGIPNAQIFCFDNGKIHTCTYEETDSYKITEMFINNRKSLLQKLLDE